jgi:hypothetical protein
MPLDWSSLGEMGDRGESGEARLGVLSASLSRIWHGGAFLMGDAEGMPCPQERCMKRE